MTANASHGWWAMEHFIDHGPNGEYVWALCFDPQLAGWPQLFRTRRECRAWIEAHHGYIRTRDDLKRMGWRMPRAVMVSIVQGEVMTDIPAVGMHRTAKHTYYWNGDGPFPGVTSVLGVIDKPALVAWAKRETAECAIRNLDLLEGMVRMGGDRMAVEWLKGIPDYTRDKAADLGTRVHASADGLSRGEPADLDAEEMPFLDAYRTALEREGIAIEAAEFMVIGSVGAHRYGGTADLLAIIDGERWLIDLKTSKGAYKETALQLVAYGTADFIGYEGIPTAYGIPPVERYGVLHIRPDLYTTPQEGGYRLIEYEVGESTREAFEAAYRLSQWLSGPNPMKGPNR